MLRILVLAAVSGILPLSAADAQERRVYRYCHTIYDSHFGQQHCQFTSFEQCRATASGLGGQCDENPEWTVLAQQRQQHSKRKPVR